MMTTCISGVLSQVERTPSAAIISIAQACSYLQCTVLRICFRFLACLLGIASKHKHSVESSYQVSRSHTATLQRQSSLGTSAPWPDSCFCGTSLRAGWYAASLNWCLSGSSESGATVRQVGSQPTVWRSNLRLASYSRLLPWVHGPRRRGFGYANGSCRGAL